MFRTSTAGVYTSAVANAVGFLPGCAAWRVLAYWGIAAATVFTTVLIFAVFDCFKILDALYLQHDTLLELTTRTDTGSQDVNEQAGLMEVPRIPRVASGSVNMGISVVFPQPVCNPSGDVTQHKYSAACWSAAICQAVAIAMNISLTSLANQISHGNTLSTQQLILTKLLGDFVGRVASFGIPKPSTQAQLISLHSVKVQSILLWLVGVVRLPLWLTFYLRTQRGPAHDIISDEAVLNWCVWLPFIASGALSSSWCIIIAICSAPEEHRVSVNLLMSLSIYAGFSIGIAIAVFS